MRSIFCAACFCAACFLFCFVPVLLVSVLTRPPPLLHHCRMRVFACQTRPQAAEAVALIRATTEELIAKCKSMVDAEEAASFGEGYINDTDPSVLRFLIASRCVIAWVC